MEDGGWGRCCGTSQVRGREAGSAPGRQGACPIRLGLPVPSLFPLGLGAETEGGGEYMQSFTHPFSTALLNACYVAKAMVGCGMEKQTGPIRPSELTF